MSDMTAATTATGDNPVRVLIVDDHGLFRAGVRAEIESAVEVVGEAAGVDDAVVQIERSSPAVVLLDVHMPDGGGLEVIRQVAERQGDDQASSPRFLALSVSDDPEDVVAIIRAGARGYVTKTIAGTDLIDAIRRVSEGDAVFSPQLAGFVLDAFAGTSRAGTAPDDSGIDRLTPREREVLQLIARGYLYKEIARRLDISVKTVEAHSSSVLRKLQLSTRHELSHWASQHNLLD